MPGAGHALAKSRGRAVIYFICTLGLFCFGVLYGARLQFHIGFDDPLAVVRSTAQVVSRQVVELDRLPVVQPDLR